MRLQYRHDAKPVAFQLNLPGAQHVSLVIHLAKGDKPSTRGMHKGIDGVWHAKVELPRGRHMYRFLVDGVPTLDPASRGDVADDHGAMWSMREVGH
jgi:1,4-alpha-glucan branching enzyme